MSENGGLPRAPGVARDAERRAVDADASRGPIGVSAGANGRQEGEISASAGKRKRANEDAREERKTDDEEETESEVEEEGMDEALEGEEGTPPPSTAVSLGVLGGADDEEEEEEEDEEFPTQRRKRSRDMAADEETKGDAPEERPAPEDEEEEVEDEDEDEDTKSGEEDDQAGHEGRAVPPWRRPKTSIDVKSDENFLRELLVQAPRMARGEKRRVVWEDVASRFPNRFKSGHVALARFQWLQQVAKDKAHDSHRAMTDSMKKMIREFNANVASRAELRASPKLLRKRHKVEFTDPVKRRKARRSIVGEDDEEEENRERSGQEKDKQTRAEPRAEPVNAATAALPTLDIAEEEAMMQSIVDREEDFTAGVIKKTEVWDGVARDSGGRFVSGDSVRRRVVWLLRIQADPQHREHSKLTPKLRKMLDKYVAFNGRTPPIVPRRRSATTEEAAVGPRVSLRKNNDGFEVFSKEQRKAAKQAVTPGRETSDTARDELLVRLCLEKKLYALPNNNKAQVWAEIAAELQHEDPRFATGAIASGRFKWLRKVLADSSHAEHTKLSESLKKMLYEFNEKSGAFHAQFLTLNESTPREEPNEGEEEEEGDEEDDGDEDEEEEEEEADEGRPARKRKRMQEDESDASDHEGKKSARSVNFSIEPESDELLLRLLLEKRPFDAHRYDKGDVWRDILSEMQKKNSKIVNGITGHGRVRYLLNCFKNPSHSEHNHLTEPLREMLSEYSDINDSLRADALANVLNLSTEMTAEEEISDPADDIMLREALRMRPFHGKSGAMMSIWKQVAASVNRQVGETVFPTAQSCQSRMKKMLWIMRAPATSNQLTSKQRIMLTFIDALQKVRWPRSKTGLTEQHKACLAKIKDLLSGKLSTAGPITGGWKSHIEHRAHVSRDPPLPPRERANGHDVLPTPNRHHVVQPQPSYQPIANMDQVSALQHEVIKLRATAARDRATFEEQIQSLREEVAFCREQLSTQGNSLDQERQEHREELRAMVDMLQHERKMHQDDTAKMIRVVEKEREDRRDEFVAMMNLVTQSVLQRAQPAQPPQPPPQPANPIALTTTTTEKATD